MGQTLEQASNNYQRDEILKDTTKTTIGFETTATPDDVFQKYGEEIKNVQSGQYKLLQEYTTNGTYTFTVPQGITKICAFVIGAGAGGDANYIYSTSSSTATSGGASGDIDFTFKDVTSGSSINVVVGKGGAGGFRENNDNTKKGAENGGSSSFDTTTVGEGGSSTTGFQMASNDYTYGGYTPYGGTILFGVNYNESYTGVNGYKIAVYSLLNQLLQKQKYYFFAGGYSQQYKDNTTNNSEKKVTINGYYSSAGVNGTNISATATKSNCPGSGGGSASTNGPSGKSQGAAGVDGAVIIFGR